MLFTDALFLFYFLPAALALHAFVVKGAKNKTYPWLGKALFFGLTLVFYGFGETWWVLPFLIGIAFDFLWAALLDRELNPTRRKLWLICSLTQNLGMLAFFKYREFLFSWAPALPKLYQNSQAAPLPPGISFYTFESLSFVIDVYRKRIRPPKNPLDFFGFIGMFPRFIAGPIVRYETIANQFEKYSGMQWERGLFTFVTGLFLKCVFADSFAFFTHYAFGAARLECLSAWIGVVAYTMQIYFDFAGYSLMAVGLGRCFGFAFPENFARPYLSTSLQEFWRRWHISLSTWLRDYLYVPLGGNRKGPWRTSLNLWLTMVIGGLWHGSNWTFVLWGVWHGSFLCLERVTGLSSRVPRFLGRVLTLLIVMGGWVWFKSATPQEALRIFSVLFPWHSSNLAFNAEAIVTRPFTASLCGLGLAYCFLLEPWLARRPAKPFTLWEQAWGLALFATALLVGFSEAIVPFLYFQF